MKKLQYLSLVIFTTLVFFSSIVAQDINPKLYSNTWQDNETRSMYGYNITKIFGRLPNNAATYNYSPITAVSYKNIDTLDANFKKVGDVENWKPEEQKENTQNLNKISPGGQIQLYLTRYSESNANLRWYFVILRAKDDKGKLWEYNLPYKAPQNPINNGWWNYTTIDIPISIPDSFYIYLNNKNSGYLSDFKFLVEKIK